MNKKANQYDIILTDDGSETLFSHLYNESCHSASGAKAETKLHYIEGCRIEQAAKNQSELAILEVGFGTGIGFDETCKALESFDIPIRFVSFEIDRQLIDRYQTNNQEAFIFDENKATLLRGNIELIIYIGDARLNIKSVKHKFDAIYQDAFSPKKNADLWTTEWFRDLKQLANEGCIMSTYSASSSIRKSMMAAGWKLSMGDQFGSKKSSTRAKITGTTDSDITQQLERSPAPEITDKNYKEYQEGKLS